jgi:hypothetical protein
LQFKENERERSFKYAELAFKDWDSARLANVTGGTQRALFWQSVLMLVLGLPVGTSVLVV